MSEATPERPGPRFLAALARLEREAPAALSGTALDLACGSGRHARWLAARGMAVAAVDRDPAAIARLPAWARVADLEAPGFELGEGRYSLIVVVNYLHRALCPALVRALAPGGALFYETFTRAQASLGRPSNPDFLLRPGELTELFAGLRVLIAGEGRVEGPAEKAWLLALRDADPARVTPPPGSAGEPARGEPGTPARRGSRQAG